MKPALSLLLVLTGCGFTPEQMAAAPLAVGIGSIAVMQRSPADAVYSLISGRDCSIVRIDKGQSYCRPVDPKPEDPPFCTRSLGVTDCWKEPSSLPGTPTETADGPKALTPGQEKYRTRGWLF